jgi:uncharacterized protein
MLTTALVAVCGLGVLPARAATPEVRDEGGVFSATAIEKANQVIRTIHRDLRKELLVETFASVPKDRVNDYARNREEFFAGFVRDRAQAEGLEGIYVMVMKEPPPHRFRIQVGVGQATRQRAFRPADRDQLVRVFQSSFREDHYDEALLQGVAFVQSTLRKNLQGGAVPAGPARSTVPIAQSFRSQPSSGGGVPSFLILGLVVVGGLILLSFVLRLFRGAMGGGRGGLAGSRGLGGPGGGGFFSGLLGGIGGAMAGSWLYDHLAGRNAQAGEPPLIQSDAPSSDVGGDYSSSGGDVDSGGGGGDFGGGGGDFGGGGDA